MSRKRQLRPEELDLWDRVTQTTKRLHPKTSDISPPITLAPKPQEPKTPPVPLEPFRVGQGARPKSIASPSLLSPADRLADAPVRMDAKAFGRLKRGKLVPEARLDLHGLTLDQAHPELIRFILTSQIRGLRLVLVITGKGQKPDPHDPMPLRRGVLRQHVPQWLRMPPLTGAILQVSEAHVRHGGGGAFYVYLVRRR